MATVSIEVPARVKSLFLTRCASDSVWAADVLRAAIAACICGGGVDFGDTPIEAFGVEAWLQDYHKLATRDSGSRTAACMDCALDEEADEHNREHYRATYNTWNPWSSFITAEQVERLWLIAQQALDEEGE